MNKNISIWAIGFLVFFLTPHLLFAQRVSGIIVDENGRNLPFTTISIKGNSTWNTLANNQAQFDLQLPPGNYKLVAQHVGYETNETDILVQDKNTDIKIVLKAQRLMMQELVLLNLVLLRKY